MGVFLVSNSRLIAQFWTISVKFLGLGVGTLGEQVLPTKAAQLGASSARMKRAVLSCGHCDKAS